MFATKSGSKLIKRAPEAKRVRMVVLLGQARASLDAHSDEGRTQKDAHTKIEHAKYAAYCQFLGGNTVQALS